MKVTIWGSTGSLPVALHAQDIRSKVVQAVKAAQGRTFASDKEIEAFIAELPFAVGSTYGGNTSCVQVQNGEEYVLFDAGTGLRDFGLHVMQTNKSPCTMHIFMSHLHWDHIQGFPFFIPAFIKGNRINFYGCHEEIEHALRSQQQAPFFPVDLDYMQAERTFKRLEAGKEYEIAGFRVTIIEQFHPGVSYGYRLEKDGKTMVYSTDSEHKDIEDGFLDFFRDADLLIFDAQYSLMDSLHTKENWGHSSNMLGVELAIEAGVKHLCLFHNEPTHGDETLDTVLDNTRKYAALHDDTYPLTVSLAYDGMVIDL